MKKIFAAIIVFGIKTAAGQTAATNTGVLYIGSGAVFSAASDLSNNSSATLTNNGNLYVAGNLANNQAGMATGTGTLFLNGSVAQAVTGTQPFITNHLNSNNAAGITLNNNLQVYGTHTFTNGVITTSSTPNYLVYQAGSSYTGDGDASHVNGWVKKFGATNFVFPVGNGTVERTVALNSLSASSEFNVKYPGGNTPNSYSTVLPLRTVDIMEYWVINSVSGGTATVTLNWDKSKVYFPNYILADIVVAGYNGSAWTDQGGTATGNVNTTGTITSNTQSTFNMFTFGSISWILPVTLTDFTAKWQDHYTQINWTTQHDLNTDHFIVERSDDGSNFYPVAQVAARNSGNAEQYSTRDNTPIHHIAYYRLRNVDTDHKETFSRIIAVTESGETNQLYLVTNPVIDRITLLATGQLTGNFNYQLVMMNGQLVQLGSLSIQNGGRYDIPFNRKLNAGTYSLRVSNRSQQFIFKVLVL